MSVNATRDEDRKALKVAKMSGFSDVKGLLERLKEDIELLQDGYQSNLTERWHSITMKEAAQDISEAIAFIEACMDVDE